MLGQQPGRPNRCTAGYLHLGHRRTRAYVRPADRPDHSLLGYRVRGAHRSTPGAYTSVSASNNHTCAVRTYGTIQCWGGSNYYGETDAPAGTYTAVAAGDNHSCGLLTDGTIRCWGTEFGGITEPPAGTYTSASSGYNHTCAVVTDGSARCWGYNGGGQSDVPDDGGT